MYELPTWSILPACSGDFTRYEPLIQKADHDPSIRNHLSALRNRQAGNDANRCLSIFLYVHWLRQEAQAKEWRLLRFLLLRLCARPPIQAERRGKYRGGLMLCKAIAMSTVAKSTADWVSNVGYKRSRVVGSKGYHRCCFVRPRASPCRGLDRRTPLDGDRVHLKLAALWAHSLPLYRPLLSRDDRASDLTSCRCLITVDFYVWLALAALIVLGGWIIWWATERAWGKFS